MKKRINKPAEDLFSEVVVEPDTTSGKQTTESDVQVDSPQLVELGAFFDASLAGDENEAAADGGGITVEPPAIETCEPQTIDETAKKTVDGNPSQTDIENVVKVAKEAMGIIAKAFRDAAKAIVEAMSDPAVQEAIKAAADEISDATKSNLPTNEPPKKKRGSKSEAEPAQQVELIESAEPDVSPDPPAITDPWDTPLADTDILEGIKRFGDQRKQSVIDACPTVRDLYIQAFGSAGLTKIGGVGKKIAVQIAENITTWEKENGLIESQSVATGADGAMPAEGQPSESPSNATEPEVTARPDQPTAQASGDGGVSGVVSSDSSSGDVLNGLNVLGEREATDPQAAKSRQILVELVAKFRESGPSGHQIGAEHQQFYDRGRNDAENDVPGDDCIYTADSLIYAWAWGWVCASLEAED